MYRSRRAYNPSDFDGFWKPIVRVFQVFCVSHYSIFNTNIHFYGLIYFIAYTLLHIWVMVHTLSHIQIHDTNVKYTGSPLMGYVGLISISGNFITHICANLEAFFTRNDEKDIYRKLREINEIFGTKLNYVVDYHAIRCKYLRTTVIFFIFSASLSFGLSFFSLLNYDNASLFLSSRVASVIMVRVRRCQIAFHINSLTHILWDLQILLKRQQKEYRGTNTGSAEKIQYLRDVYSNTWLIKNLISSCFGWSLITLLIEFTTELINFLYWAYINAVVYKSMIKLIRKILRKTWVRLWNGNFMIVNNFRNNMLHYNDIGEFWLFLLHFWTVSKCGKCKVEENFYSF